MCHALITCSLMWRNLRSILRQQSSNTTTILYSKWSPTDAATHTHQAQHNILFTDNAIVDWSTARLMQSTVKKGTRPWWPTWSTTSAITEQHIESRRKYIWDLLVFQLTLLPPEPIILGSELNLAERRNPVYWKSPTCWPPELSKLDSTQQTFAACLLTGR